MAEEVLLKDYCPAVSHNGGITTDDIKNGAITPEKLSDDFQLIEVSDGSITEDKLADGAVTTDKLDDEAVTDAKLAFIPVKIVKGTVNYDSDPTTTIAILPANSILLKAITVCNTAFDGSGAKVEVGITGAVDSIIDSATLTLDAVTATDNDFAKVYASETDVIATLTEGTGATEGSLDVYLVYATVV